jgi:hypothetical protein
MTDEQWSGLAPYAEAAIAAKIRLQGAEMRNARYESERERMEASLAYERLRLEADRAEREYETMQNVILGRA